MPSWSMETVLKQLNSTPGVMGSLICDPEGQVVAQAFPPIDAVLLRDAAMALVDSITGLEKLIGAVGALDFRYGEARLVAKPIPGATLLVLCSKSVNLELLGMALAVVIKKIGSPETIARAKADTASGRGGQKRDPLDEFSELDDPDGDLPDIDIDVD